MPSTFWARQDSGAANNPALNLTGADSQQITFVNQTPGGDTGDLFLDQPSGGGIDPDTVVSIGGTTYSFTFEIRGTLPTQNSNGAQQVPDQYQDSTVVIITVHDYPSIGDSMRLSFLPDDEATQAEMDSFGNGAIDIQNTTTSPGSTPVCFVRGTQIETQQGQTAIEELRAGDLVKTLDHGYQPIRWIGSSRFPARGNFAPIRIHAGALGNTRDLLVSPQHRMMLTGWRLEMLFGDSEVLVSAQSLINDQSIRREPGGMIEYYHMLFDTHEIVFAEGAPSESLHLGTEAIASLRTASVREIYQLFPELQKGNTSNGQSARLCLKSYESSIAARELAHI
ncbi:MAG: Hint domain-containing protein [Rhodobacteraceae bacterium]|nr:Hint domain-containing protein [Paracoccaceae bacterium]